MDADEERNFAALLSQSTALPSRPTWSPPTSSRAVDQVDPWANPFASNSPTNPFSSIDPSAGVPNLYNPGATTAGFEDYAQSSLSSSSIPAFTSSNLDLNGVGETSPYVQKLEDENVVPRSSAQEQGQVQVPEPPSVLAARERDRLGFNSEPISGGYGNEGFGEGGFGASRNTTDDWGATDLSGIQGTASSTYTSPPALPPNSPPSTSTSKIDQSPTTSPAALTNANPNANGRPAGRILPSDLIDEDLMAASDPSISLKKAFVRSTPRAQGVQGTPEKQKQGAYVFRPAGKGSPVKTKEVRAVKNGDTSKEVVNGNKEKVVEPENTSTAGSVQAEKKGDQLAEEQKQDVPPRHPVGDEAAVVIKKDQEVVQEKQGSSAINASTDVTQQGSINNVTTPAKVEDSSAMESETVSSTATNTSTDDAGNATSSSSRSTAPTSIPLPDSIAPSRISTPLPPIQPQSQARSSPILPAATETPTRDRVAVSPLEPPSSKVGDHDDFGFKSLAIGGTSSPFVPPASGGAHEGWGGEASSPLATTNGSRFGAKGWGVVQADEDEGLFGRGGPVGDPWGGSGGAADNGWGEATAGPSSPPPPALPPIQSTPAIDTYSPSLPTPSTSPVKPRRKTHPVFTISISDPARVGDPVRGYTVYTIRTRTTSPHYRKSEFTALRRFSDFLWLFDSLISNNPGIIVPPVPDKHTFGRFQEQFIETRRLALERSLNKITSHPVLQLDPDLRLFLESDNFAMESKQRRPDTPDVLIPPPQKSGILGWAPSAPRYIETDDWFTSRSAFLDSLEAQLKSLSKAIEVSSKARLDMAAGYGEVAEALGALADSDLGSAMCAALARLADLAKREKEGAEELAKGDVVNLLNMADEYVRFVGSVRRAMAGRVKVWGNWQALDREVGRLKGNREKLRVAGKLGDRAAQTLAEINEADRRARESKQEFDTQTKLVKSEFTRFERERVDDFKHVLERYLEEQIAKQRELIMAWEEYHAGVLGMVKKAQGVKEGQVRAAVMS